MLLCEAIQLLAEEKPSEFEAQKAAIQILLQSRTAESPQLFASIIRSYENPILHSLAITALSEIANQDCIELLTSFLLEPERLSIRRLAARALGYSRQASALPALKHILSSPGSEWDQLPVSEVLWALNCLLQLEIVSLDEDLLQLLEDWQEQPGEIGLLARLSLQKSKLNHA